MNMQLVLSITPPPKFYVSATYTSKVHVYVRTQLQNILHKTVDTGGDHVNKASWSPYIREELPVQREVNNIHDDFAVAVLKNSNTVGHVPRERFTTLITLAT